ncbi:SDR family NAD(P)-dependent oxidoreductase [Aneurinibacillus uraniidurans]|uniref:SDR family NAD(P)-dependent oxidoreductase n=1 Tax=Aneurinibacillus uraniidurans TaxID=2966586 RepID=UPI00234A7222|nr:SDR family oxidoreductase [Aneurinibacillus sp. B1]WCN37029.1 SDR family NAD(P)-dependent oxidoreductase [Aneurinibacillus sp. B1]
MTNSTAQNQTTTSTQPAVNGGRKLQDKVTVITGGNGGLGRAIALSYIAEGAKVVLAARNEETMAKVHKEIEELGADVLSVATDVASESDCKNLFEKTIERFGRVDILVNNAGISGPTGSVAELSLEDWNTTLNIDITGAFLCTKEAAKLMIPQNSGNIINVSSIFGKRAYPYRSPYAVAKWGMIGFTQSVAAELGKHNIRVNCICPGPVQGPRIERVWQKRAEIRNVPWEVIQDKMLRMAALRRIPTEDEVGKVALFLACDDSASMTGQSLNVSCGTEMR